MYSSSLKRVGVVIVLCSAACAAQAGDLPTIGVRAPGVAPAAVASGVHAAPPLTAPPATVRRPGEQETADELTHLHDRTVVLEAQLKELDAQAKVAGRMAALDTLRGVSSHEARLVSVERVGATRLATILLRDGSEFEVAPGEQLPDGARVVSIDADGVVVQPQGGKPSRLRVVSMHSRTTEAAMNGIQTFSRNAADVPPLPPLQFPRE